MGAIQRFVLPYQTAVDAIGVPYTDGFLYFYASGTNTLLATYQDQALTIPNANPIEADGAGRFGNIFLGPNAYKVVLTDNFGNQIWTADPVTDPSNALGGSTGASQIGFEQPATGAVVRTVQSKLTERVSVFDFGAVGDGVTDDTAAIQACFNYCGNHGRVAWFPQIAGATSTQFKTTSALSLGGQAAGIEFESALVSLMPSGSGYTVLTTSPGIQISRFEVRMDCQGATLNGVLMNQPIDSRVQNIEVYNAAGRGIQLLGVEDTVIETMTAYNCGNGTSGTPAFSMGEYSGDPCNCIHILRLQVEQANGSAITIDDGTLYSTIENIHSEQAKPVVGLTTWALGGSSCTYSNMRLEANSPSANATAVFSGAATTFITPRIEGSISLELQGSAATAGITVIGAICSGPATNVVGQNGPIVILGGTFSSLSGQPGGWRVFAAQIAALAIGDAANDPTQAQFTNCDIAALTSTNSQSSATFTTCDVAECNSLLAAITVINGGKFVSAGSIAPTFGAQVYANNATMIAAGFAPATSSFIFSRGTIWNGPMSFTGSLGCTFDDASYVTGTVTGFTAPTVAPLTTGIWPKGARTKNIAPAVGSPKAWVVSTAGNPGTWTSEGNL